MRIHYNETTGELLGYTTFGNSPEPFIEADISPEEYDGYKTVIDGGLIAKTQEEIEAESAEALEVVKATMRAEIKAHSDKVKDKGFLFKGYHIQCDVESRENIGDMVQNSALLTYPFDWQTYENIDVSIDSAEELAGLNGLKVQFVSETFAARKVAQDSLKAATTEEAAQAVVDLYKENNPI